MTIYYEPDDEFIEYGDADGDSVMGENIETGTLQSPPVTDPIFVASITLIVGLVLFGFLNRYGVYVFGEAIKNKASLISMQLEPVDEQKKQTDETKFENTPLTISPQNLDVDCAVSSRFPTKVTRWCGLITQYAAKHNLDPDLVAAVVWLESGGNELAYSRSGAVGLMQIMPRDGLAASFMCANGPCFRDRPSSDQLRDPEFNIAFGTRFLASLVRRYGDVREALKSYGPMDAGYTYSDKVLSIFNRYRDN